jgi:hypothetical protein
MKGFVIGDPMLCCTPCKAGRRRVALPCGQNRRI